MAWFPLTPSLLEPPRLGPACLIRDVADDHEIDPPIGRAPLWTIVICQGAVFGVPSSRDQRRIEPVSLDQQGHHRSGARGGELPVRLEAGIVDGHVVGMTFYPDFETPPSQNGGNSSQSRVSVLQQLSLAAAEESDFTQADHESLGSNPHLHFVLADFISESALE